MARKVISELIRTEIRAAMTGLTGTPARLMAEHWAGELGVRTSTIYRMTEDLRRRKKRSDAGTRKYDLIEGTDVWEAAKLVVAGKLDPVEAYDTVLLRNPDAQLPHLEYFRAMLADKQLGAKQRKKPTRPHRRWEADKPGEIFQVDVTALKVRWQDERTRRILRIDGIDKNHPQMDKTKLRVWQIMLCDDFSRRRFLRYVTTTAITSTHMVRFLCEAFSVLGVPLTLYTDNGSEFKGRHAWAAVILNKILEHDGGYKHETHAAGNPQASGKVEVAHQWAEKMDRLVGLAVEEGQKITVDELNIFADRITEKYAHTIHRSTKQTPMDRWYSKPIIVRMLPKDTIESALLTMDCTPTLSKAMTLADGKGREFKVPGIKPFVDFIEKKLQMVVPETIDWILITPPNKKGEFLPDQNGLWVSKKLATADKAGDYKRVAATTAEEITKRLKDERAADIRAIKERNKLTGEIAPVPHLNVEMPLPEGSNILHHPHAQRNVTADEVNAVVPIMPGKDATQMDLAPEDIYIGDTIGYWRAVAEYSPKFNSVDQAKEYLLGLFPNMEGERPAIEIEAFIAERAEKPRLKAVS